MKNVKWSFVLLLIVMAVVSGVSLGCSNDEYDEPMGLKTMARRKASDGGEFRNYYVNACSEPLVVEKTAEYSKCNWSVSWSSGLVIPRTGSVISCSQPKISEVKKYPNETRRVYDVGTFRADFEGVDSLFPDKIRISGVANCRAIIYYMNKRTNKEEAFTEPFNLEIKHDEPLIPMNNSDSDQ